MARHKKFDLTINRRDKEEEKKKDEEFESSFPMEVPVRLTPPDFKEEKKIKVKVIDPICICGHPQSVHGMLFGNVRNAGMCETINCSCKKFEKGE